MKSWSGPRWTVAVADSLLPGEAVLVLRRETQQHRAEQESDHDDSKRDSSRHERNVGTNMPYRESPIGVKWRTRVSRANSSKRAFAKQLVIARYQEDGRGGWRPSSRGYANGTFCCIGAGDVSDSSGHGYRHDQTTILEEAADVGLSKEPRERVQEMLKNAASYTEDVLRDQQLRSNIRSAAGHAAVAAERVRQNSGLSEFAARVERDS